MQGTALALSWWPLTFPGSSIALCKAFILILTPLLHRHVILKSIKSDILLDWSHFLIAPIHLSLCSHSTSLSLSQMTSIGFLSSGHTECVRNVCELQTASCCIHSPFCAFLSRCQLYPANYPPSHKLVSERERGKRVERQTDGLRKLPSDSKVCLTPIMSTADLYYTNAKLDVLTLILIVIEFM